MVLQEKSEDQYSYYYSSLGGHERVYQMSGKSNS